MSRLPLPGNDANIWGDLLNDFLQVSHTSTGVLRDGIVGDAQVSSLSQAKISGLSASLAAKIDHSTITTKGDILVGSGASTIVRLGIGSNGQVLTADASQTSGMRWATPGLNDQWHVPGLVGDGVTDDAPVIQTVLEELGTSNHSLEIIVELPPGGIIYINSTVQIQTSNTTLRFASPVRYGPLGRIRIQGEVDEQPTVNKPFLTADSLEGSTTLTVNNMAPFSVGDYIIIRGARDATGNPARDQKVYNSIIGIAGNTMTLEQPLEEDFLAFNPNPTAPPGTSHESQVTRVVGAHVTGAANRGDRVVTVDNTSVFSVGDYVQMLDDAHTSKPDGTIEKTNFKHREMAEVKQIISGTQIRLSHALYHTYDLTKNARLIRTLPVVQSRILDATVTWAAMSTVGNAFEIKYGVNCEVTRCSVTGGASGSWRNQAFRMSDSYFSQVTSCYAHNPQDTSSGRGYGATFYGATACELRDSHFSSCRHSVLMFNGAAGNIVADCRSEDCCISDYDVHGADCVDNLFTDCIAVGGDSEAADGPFAHSACKVGNTSHIDGDAYNVFNNILVVNYIGSAFEVIPTSHDNTFRNCRVTGATTGIKLIALAANTALVTANTHFDNISFDGITGAITNIDGNAATAMIQGLTLTNCRFEQPTTGLTIRNASSVQLQGTKFFQPNLPAVTYALNASNVANLRVVNNDFSGSPRGVKLATCPGARVYGNTFYDLVETTVYEDAGGNTNTLFARNDIYGFAPIVSTTGTSTGGLIDIGLPYVPDTPARHGFAEWNYDVMVTGSGAGQATTTGTLYLLKVSAQTGGTIQNIIMTIGSTAPAGALVAGQNFIGLYDSSGALIAQTADQSVTWATSGLQAMPLTAPVTLQGGRDYYVGILSNSAAGTAAVFVRSSSGTTTTANANLSNAAQRFSTNGTGLTNLPASVTLASNSGSGAQPFWAALA